MEFEAEHGMFKQGWKFSGWVQNFLPGYEFFWHFFDMMWNLEAGCWNLKHGMEFRGSLTNLMAIHVIEQQCVELYCRVLNFVASG